MGVRQALSQQEDFDLLDKVLDDNLMETLETDSPDVLILGVDFPSLNGMKMGRKVLLRFPTMRLIVLSSNFDNGELFEAIKIGAAAYLNKNITPEELSGNVRRAFRGEYPINDSLLARPKVAETVLKQFQNMESLGKAMESVAVPLTQRETQILNLIANGNSNKQIARTLEISEQTIKNHVSSILRKLNANDRAHAVVLAMKHGWILAE